MPTDEQSRRWYEDNAKFYTEHVRDKDDSVYHSLYEKPAMYSLLPDLRGKTALSLGCGSGEDCSHLLSLGAERVVGIDLSTNLIGIAKASYPDCEFQVMDMETLSFPDNSFDFVYSSLAIHYIEDWHKVFSEVYRVLKPNSFFLFSCNHPVYSAAEVVEDNDKAKVSKLIIDRDRVHHTTTITGDYMHARAIPSQTVVLDVTTWHKPIGEVATEASDEGFLIKNILEPRPLERMKEVSPRDYQVLNAVPYFIIFKLLKP